ncbi:MAG: inositol monophosphatase family protein [Chitinivibrionales bacterium]|nr:inositol monophosphatase family protein [Chitinivibrionales bacterium]
MTDIISVARAAALEAGTFLKDHFGHALTITEKYEHELVTQLDRQAEDIIAGHIRAAFPGHNILGEEGGASDNGGDYLWIIDPLDGTHNFIRSMPLFGVSIGVVYKKEHVAGVVYIPCETALYCAERGGGAFKNDRKITVSKTAQLRGCTLAYDSSLFVNPERMCGVLGDLARHVFNVRMLGSSACNLTYLACGSVDACIEFDDKPWDSAGGVTIIREAGGTVTNLAGEPFTLEDNNYIASNTLLHPRLLEIVGGKLR